jgi:probable phosphoglycerate mutase
MDRRLVYLVRHGEIQRQGEYKRFIGQLDWPLSTEGIRQAQRLSQELSGVQLAAIWCSDLKRSLKTAEIIADRQNVCPQVRRDLREINMGIWEGITFEEIRRRYPKEFEARGQDIVHYRPPGGETFLDCSERAIATFQEILDYTEGNILIVGHAGVNRVILCHVLGMPLQNLLRIGQDYGCLNLIDHGAFGYCLRVLNMVPGEDTRRCRYNTHL